MPLLVHLGISFAAVFIAGFLCELWGHGNAMEMDAALATTLGAVCSIPVLWKMWKEDRRKNPAFPAQKARTWWFYAGAFLGGILASCAGSFFMERSGIKNYLSNQAQEELFASGFMIQVLGLGIAVPVAEELVYRGLLYQRLREFMSGKYAAGTAALIFALSHGNMIQFLYALPMALILHWLYGKCGSLAAPMLFHMGANLISVAVEAMMHGG